MKIKRSSIFIVIVVAGNLILLYFNIIKTDKNLFDNTLEINKKKNLINVLKDLNKIKFHSIDEESESFKTLFNQQDYKLIVFLLQMIVLHA